MGNRIQIRHGSDTPLSEDLLPYELGFDSYHSILYINKGSLTEVDVTETDFNAHKTEYYYEDDGQYIQCTNSSIYDSNTTYYWYPVISLGGTGAYLPLTGGTVTGNIILDNGAVLQGSITGNAATASVATKTTYDSEDNVINTTYLKLSGGTMTGDIALNTYVLKVKSTTDYYENYKLPIATQGLAADVDYTILTNRDLITIAQGGTGASTAVAALSNLGGVASTTLGVASGVATLDTNIKVTPAQASSKIIDCTVDRTLLLSDAGTFIKCDSVNDLTITIPANNDIAYPIGTEIEFIRYNTGKVTFQADTGVTINSVNGALEISDQYGCACIKKLDTDTWILSGLIA